MLDGAPPRPLPGAAVGSEEEEPDDEEEALLLRDLRVAQAPPGSSHAGRESELAGQPSELQLVDGPCRRDGKWLQQHADANTGCKVSHGTLLPFENIHLKELRSVSHVLALNQELQTKHFVQPCEAL